MKKFFILFFLPLACAADPLSLGKFTAENRQSGAILAAPHGGFDLNTENIVAEVAEKIKWSSLTAVGFRKRVHPYNVNRPTEGIGIPSSEEKHSAEAKAIYAAYRKKLSELKEVPELYVEIHGEAKLESRIEIATVGVSEARAARLKELFQAALGGDQYQVAIEGVDEIAYVAGANKKFGVLKDVPLALHIELPWSLRNPEAPLAKRALTEFLPKASVILLGD